MYNGQQEGLLAMKEVDVSISGALQNWDLSRLYYYGEVRDGLTYDYFKETETNLPSGKCSGSHGRQQQEGDSERFPPPLYFL